MKRIVIQASVVLAKFIGKNDLMQQLIRKFMSSARMQLKYTSQHQLPQKFDSILGSAERSWTNQTKKNRTSI